VCLDSIAFEAEDYAIKCREGMLEYVVKSHRCYSSDTSRQPDWKRIERLPPDRHSLDDILFYDVQNLHESESRRRQ